MHVEMTMKHLLDVRPVKLPARAIHRINNGRGLQITAVEGVVWVTQANDGQDVILRRAQSFIIDRNGLTVVFALRDAAVIVGPAGHVTAADFRAARAHGSGACA
jgi:hypothetical protein